MKREIKGALIYFLVTIIVRMVNYQHSLYFIWDMGRDAYVLKQMVTGDLKLLGPTTGLPGLFLGPLWYYAGLPGFWLTNGNPYGFQLWYIILTSLSSGIIYFVIKRLIKIKWIRVLAWLLFAIIPGSISGHVFVWNPMLSIPLMAAAFYFLAYGRSRWQGVALGFFCLGLVLQSEFAYGVFFVIITLFCLPLMTSGNKKVKLLAAVIALGVTLLPQMLFEIKSNFLMIRSVMTNLVRVGTTVSYADLWQIRPQQFWLATMNQFFKTGKFDQQLMILFLGVVIVGWIESIRSQKWPYQLLAFWAVVPYISFLFWRGNYGYFFDYYLTPHYIFLLLLFCVGVGVVLKFKCWWKFPGLVVVMMILIGLMAGSVKHYQAVILTKTNNGGLKVMLQAVEKFYTWRSQDDQDPGVLRIYTPNLHTENYDYLVEWWGNNNQEKLPLTVLSANDTVRYVLREPEEHVYEARFLPWYQETTTGFTLINEEKIGVLTLERWKRIGGEL